MTSRRPALLLVVAASLSAALAASGFVPGDAERPTKELFRPELALATPPVPAATLGAELAARGPAWERLRAEIGAKAAIHVDPRSGAVASIVTAVPLVPATTTDAAVVTDSVLRFVRRHAVALGIDPADLGEARARALAADHWHVRIPQRHAGLPVRGAALVATLRRGNLVLIGTERWGNPQVDPEPRVRAEAALATALAHLERDPANVHVWMPSRLTVVPVAPAAFGADRAYDGPLGSGYAHVLAWSLGVSFGDGLESWRVLVDAHTGALLELEEASRSASRSIVGGVYPLTSTGVCPTQETCGTLQPALPMPFVNTGFAAPNDFTDTAGGYDYTSGTVTTTLDGRYARVTDTCGAISQSSGTGDLNLGGTNGDHDCTSGGGGGANTAAARSAYHETNRLVEMVRSWLPPNPWFDAEITLNVNIVQTCNGLYSAATNSINLYRSGGGCRNSGEIAGVIDHEWGHGLDDNDANGVLSQSPEAYADILAAYRLRASCIGYGFYASVDWGCGLTADGTGRNVRDSQTGPAYCTTNCSGVRELDFQRHVPATTAVGNAFICTQCVNGGSLCGKSLHCASHPAAQAAWDLAARDLQAPPFSLTREDAFNLAMQLFLRGAGGVQSWHSCACSPGSADGCSASNAYMQWLAADDDDGNLLNGTPHMSAIRDAFERHGIHCATPAVVNSGCAGGPAAAPMVTFTRADERIDLAWSAVPGAARYRVLRSEDWAGCDFGKTVVGTTVTTTLTDFGVANGGSYFYVVQALGASDACVGPGSGCQGVAPTALLPAEVVNITWNDDTTLAWPPLAEADTYSVYRGTAADVAKLASGAIDSCLRATVAGPSVPGLTETPAGDDWTWWLVRAANGNGLGPAGSGAFGPRIHDPAGACP